MLTLVRKLIIKFANWLLRLVKSEDQLSLRQLLWNTAIILNKERQEKEFWQQRYSQMSAAYWNRIKNDSQWRNNLHKLRAKDKLK